MVESDDGTLSVVSRRVVQVPPTHLGYPTEENTFKTSGFQVFEVDLSTNKWTNIKNLSYRSLFLAFILHYLLMHRGIISVNPTAYISLMILLTPIRA